MCVLLCEGCLFSVCVCVCACPWLLRTRRLAALVVVVGCLRFGLCRVRRFVCCLLCVCVRTKDSPHGRTSRWM